MFIIIVFTAKKWILSSIKKGVTYGKTIKNRAQLNERLNQILLVLLFSKIGIENNNSSQNRM